jgi:hypothetical protein
MGQCALLKDKTIPAIFLGDAIVLQLLMTRSDQFVAMMLP